MNKNVILYSLESIATAKSSPERTILHARIFKLGAAEWCKFGEISGEVFPASQR